MRSCRRRRCRARWRRSSAGWCQRLTSQPRRARWSASPTTARLSRRSSPSSPRRAATRPSLLPLPPSHTRSETRSQQGPVDPLLPLLRGRDRGNCARGGSTELFGCGAAQAGEDSLRHPRRRQGVGVSGERLRGDAELCRGGMVAETTGGLWGGHGGATAHVIRSDPIGAESLLAFCGECCAGSHRWPL